MAHTTTLTTDGKRLADALVKTGVVAELEPYMPDPDALNAAAATLFAARDGEGVGLREALIQCAAELATLHHGDCDMEHAEKHSAGLRMANAALTQTGSAGEDDTGVREVLKSIVEHVHASRYRCERTGLRLDANVPEFDHAERVLNRPEFAALTPPQAARPGDGEDDEREVARILAMSDAEVIASFEVEGRDPEALAEAMRGQMGATFRLCEEINTLREALAPFAAILANGEPVGPIPRGLLDSKLTRQDLRRATAAYRAAPQPPKAETPAGVGEVWHREGATVYTLKEHEGPRRRGGPAMVNHHSFYVQGPDAEAVAARIHAALSTAPAARPGDEVERVRHVKRGTEYEVLGEAEGQVANGNPGVDGQWLPFRDGSRLTVYRCVETGKLWCRFPDEFRDGRFIPAAAPAADGGRA